MTGNLLSVIERTAKDSGALLFGVASIDRFDGAPNGHHPKDWIQQAKSVICLGIQIPAHISAYERLLKGSERIEGELRKEVLKDHFYTTVGYDVINRNLEDIGLKITITLENEGFGTIYFPAIYSHYQKHIQERVPGRFSMFSSRHAAVRAGLGEFGLNNLVVTPQYGSRVRFLSIVTEADFEASPMLERKACLAKDCYLCIDKCSPGAITVDHDINWDQVWINPVSRTSQPTCRSKRFDAFCFGRCARVCPINLAPSMEWDDKYIADI